MPPRPPKRPHRHDIPHRQALAQPSIPPTAYIQAYEVQLVYGEPELAAAVASRGGGRSGMIQYMGDVEEGGEVWADRHDMIHLLSSMPSSSTRRPPSPTRSSSSSWDDLPSDHEETFYLSDPEEIEAYQNEKRKKWMEALREDRLREREREDRSEAIREEKIGWDDDEEPPAAIQQLMAHTAQAIISSPNPSLLEMRILANHASDERFLFLKGRWASAWEAAKKEVRDKREAERSRKEKAKGLGGLMGSYESGSDSGSEEDEAPPPPPPEGGPPPPPPADEGSAPPPPPPPPDHAVPGEGEGAKEVPGGDDEEEKKRQRRLRAEEWKRKRAAAKSD
ncbi:hypothetical protein IAT38_004268 [Cryptococcus sp. DSM 104549]